MAIDNRSSSTACLAYYGRLTAEAEMDPSGFRELVSGRRRGPAAALARFALGLFETPYTLAVEWRNHRYDQGRATKYRMPVPVVSVGNLTLGGTGKTPLVAWIARWFRQRQARVAIISRGYGAPAGTVNDEALELKQRLPDVPHVQNRDRVRAGRQAIGAFGCEVIVADDAFQHRRLARSGHCPLGRLGTVRLRSRLSPGHVARAGVRVGACAGRGPLAWRTLAAGPTRSHPGTRSTFGARCPLAGNDSSPETLRAADGSQAPLDLLKGKPLAAFCGVGNPAGFRHTLETCGYQVAAWREFSDHHHYSSADVGAIAASARQVHAAAIVCTCKDLVKLAVVKRNQVAGRLQSRHNYRSGNGTVWHIELD